MLSCEAAKCLLVIMALTPMPHHGVAQVETLALQQQQRYFADKAVAVDMDWDSITALIHSDEGKREVTSLRSAYSDIKQRLETLAKVGHGWLGGWAAETAVGSGAHSGAVVVHEVSPAVCGTSRGCIPCRWRHRDPVAVGAAPIGSTYTGPQRGTDGEHQW